MKKSLLISTFAVISAIAMTSQSVYADSYMYESDNFDYLIDYAKYGNGEKPAGNTIGEDNLDAYCPFITTGKIENKSSKDELIARGYTILETPGACAYLNGCSEYAYLKFGKKNYQGGLILPKITGIPADAACTMNIEWCPMRAGGTTQTIDPTKIVIIVKNGEDVKTFEVPACEWETGHKLEFIKASVPLTDAKIDANTEITIRPEDSQYNGASGQHRWFINAWSLVGDKQSGINDITVDENAPMEYYNLQGVRVENPENGLYIRRQGDNMTKVLIK